jgi:L-fuconate dehydratase
MAAVFDIPVCPHAGGVGLCEYVQHLSAWDYLSVSTKLENRVTEFVDHLHEHFIDPVRIRNAHYLLPVQPGYSVEMLPGTTADYAFPHGKVWTALV